MPSALRAAEELGLERYGTREAQATTNDITLADPASARPRPPTPPAP